MAERLFGTPEEMVKGYCANCTASCWFHPADTDWLCESCRYNLLENLVGEDDLPFDYELCGTCGYDHVYDGIDPGVYRRIKEAHEQEECAMAAQEINPEQDAADRAAEFEHRITGRVAEMRKPHVPRYWLEDKDGEHMIFVLVGLRQPGDGPDPRSWIRYNYPEDDMQLATADHACRRLCRPAHMSQDWGETEESGDAIWYGYYFGPEGWERIQSVLLGLLGEPGTAPPRLFAKEEDE